jgi:hypothetical protein
MPSYLAMLKTHQPYALFVMAAIWLILAVYVWSALVLWPVLALAAGGLLLMLRPNNRITWTWVTASCGYGIVLALYQAASAASLLGGTFSVVAAESFIIFILLALAQFLVVYVRSFMATKGE